MEHVRIFEVPHCPADFTSWIGTGEHGVGVGKKEYLTDELGEGTVELMRVIKQAVDPLNILNPGKVYYYSPQPEILN